LPSASSCGDLRLRATGTVAVLEPLSPPVASPTPPGGTTVLGFLILFLGGGGGGGKPIGCVDGTASGSGADGRGTEAEG